MQYDAVIVGAGFAGAVAARELAEKNKKVLVIDRRNHVAGNMYDEIDENGILIQKYGPHFFVVRRWWPVEYISRFSELYVYQPRAMSMVDGKYIWRPYNFHALQQLLGPENSEPVLKAIKESFPNQRSVTIWELLNHENEAVKKYGQLLFDKVFTPYIAKQWGKSPEEIDKAVIDRTRVPLGYEWQIDDEDYQYLPKYGYTKLFENMLNHPNITVELGVDALDTITFSADGTKALYKGEDVPHIIYTGALDELFGFEYGELPYRSRYFDFATYDADEHKQPVEVITFPGNDAKHLRQTEFKTFNYYASEPKNNRTTVALEYSVPFDRNADTGNEPYYPIINEETRALHAKYVDKANKISNFHFIGRLAEFKYLDMDYAMESAIELVKEILR